MSDQDKVYSAILAALIAVGVYLFIRIELRIRRDEKKNRAHHEMQLKRIADARAAEDARDDYLTPTNAKERNHAEE